jgi:hypothetical protein
VKVAFRPFAVFFFGGAGSTAVFVTVSLLVAAFASSCSLNPIGEDPGIRGESGPPEPNALVDESGPAGLATTGPAGAVPPAASADPVSPDFSMDDGAIPVQPAQTAAPPPNAPQAPLPEEPPPVPAQPAPEPVDVISEPEPETPGGGPEAGPDLDGGVPFEIDGGVPDAAPPAEGAR